MDGNTYTNEYIGLEFVGPVNFEYASYEDILALNGLTVDATTVDLETKLGSGSLYFMMAESDSAFATVAGLKLSIDQINELDIKEDLEATVETLEATYVADGYVDVDVNYAELTIGDTRADALIITAKLLGQDFYGAMVRYLHEDLYITVVAGATDRADVDTMLQNSSIY